MRELLFRGKRLDTGEWIIGGSILGLGENGKPGKKPEVFIPNLNDPCYTVRDKAGNIARTEVGTFYRIDISTLGQYAGVKDIQGRRIFEGDIIKAVMHGGNYDMFEFPLAAVIRVNSSFCLQDKRETTPISSFAPNVSFEIVGNVYDDPDLLGGENP